MTTPTTPSLTHLILDGLTGVGQVNLNFAPDQRVYALIGVNGVGKTKCLEALFLYWLAQNEDFLRWARKDWDFGWFAQVGLAKSFRGTLLESGDCPVVFLGAMGRASIDSRASSSPQQPSLGLFELRRQVYFAQVAQAIHSGDLATMNMSSDVHLWFVARAYSANPYQKIGDNRKVEIDTVLQLLHAFDARIDPTFLEIDGAQQVSIKVSGQETRLDHLSSGFKSLLKMLQAIVAGFANFTNAVDLRSVRGVVLIDEIESHLHVTWQAHIIPLLKRLFPHTTFYIATHSPIVLSQLQQGEAYLLQRNESTGVVESLEIAAPNRKAIYDVMNDGLGLNLNQIKIESVTPASQADAKKQLLALLNEEESA